MFPNSYKSSTALKQFHQQGRFHELKESMVVFGKQKRRNFSNEVVDEPDTKKAKEANRNQFDDQDFNKQIDEEIQNVTLVEESEGNKGVTCKTMSELDKNQINLTRNLIN